MEKYLRDEIWGLCQDCLICKQRLSSGLRVFRGTSFVEQSEPHKFSGLVWKRLKRELTDYFIFSCLS